MLLHSLRTNRSSSSALLGCATHHRFVALRELTRAHVNPDDHPGRRERAGKEPSLRSHQSRALRTGQCDLGSDGVGRGQNTTLGDARSSENAPRDLCNAKLRKVLTEDINDLCGFLVRVLLGCLSHFFLCPSCCVESFQLACC